jgi:hypothetical protein
MADSRSVMQEFRFLDQKRQAGSLTAAEQSRHAELRDLVGFEQPAPARGGFDVTAAAAQLRESLLPAGLRSRPAEPLPPSPPAPIAWTPPIAAATAPVSPAFTEPEPPLATDPFFDPSSLGQEVRPQAWNPEAPGYDPDAPYDEAAWIAAGYDPNATYDWGDAAAADAPLATEVVGDLALDAEPSFDLEPALLLDEVQGLDAPPAELPPLQFGEYDAPGAPVTLGEPAARPVPVVPAYPARPQAFGEYDAGPPAAALAAGGEPFFGGPEGDDLPGGPPLQLGEAQLGWQPEGVLDAGFELASDGSFGEAAEPPLLTPWSEADQAPPSEPWESAPALDLSAPFEAVVIPKPILEPLPAEREPEPLSLAELEHSMEIDVPPEISAAYDLAPAPAASLDFAEPLASAGVEESVDLAAEAEPEVAAVFEASAGGGAALVSGVQRVVVHLLDGQVLRGSLSDVDLEGPELALDTGAPGAVELVPSAGVKAIFFMLAPGEHAPVAQGKRVRVIFRDGRQVAGFAPDYREELAGFFVIPADARTNTGCIWVYRAAVRQVSVS